MSSLADALTENFTAAEITASNDETTPLVACVFVSSVFVSCFFKSYLFKTGCVLFKSNWCVAR